MHGHTFLLSWSGPMTFVSWPAAFIYVPVQSYILLFFSCRLYDLSSLKGLLLNPKYYSVKPQAARNNSF